MTDGSVILLARSMQYGKLQNGLVVCVPASLVPRQKTHVLSFPAPLHCDVVLGVNGWVFLTGSLGLGSETELTKQEGLAIEEELAEAIEARCVCVQLAPFPTPPSAFPLLSNALARRDARMPL